MKRSKTIVGLAEQIEAANKRLNDLGRKLGEAGVGEQYDALDREITLLLWRYYGANEEARSIASERQKIRRAVAGEAKPARKARTKKAARGPCVACGKPVGGDDLCRNPKCDLGTFHLAEARR